jgi:Putative beta-barrel porin 2
MGSLKVKGDIMGNDRTTNARRTGWVSWILLTLFFVGIPTFVHAQARNFLLKFHPYVTVEEEYTTNLFLDPNSTKIDDWVNTAIGGVRFSDTKAGRYGLDLDVSGGYNSYAYHDQYNYWSALGRLHAWYAVTPKLTFRLNDYVIRSDQAREELYENEVTGAADTLPGQSVLSTQNVHAIYVRNVVEASTEYRFGRENLASLLYRNNVYRNERENLYADSTEHSITPLLNYWFDVKNGITLEYTYTTGVIVGGQPGDSGDLKSDEVRVRYTRRVDPKLSFFGEYTYIHENLETPDVDYDVHNPSLGLEYKFSPTLTGSAQGGYWWQLEDDGNENSGPFFSLRLIQTAPKTRYALIFEGGYTRDYFTSENLGFVKYYRAYGMINHRLTPRMDVQAIGSVERPIYDDGQKDWIWEGRLRASYLLFRWLSVGLEGRYRQDHSNVSGESYVEYAGIFNITLTLNP